MILGRAVTLQEFKLNQVFPGCWARFEERKDLCRHRRIHRPSYHVMAKEAARNKARKESEHPEAGLLEAVEGDGLNRHAEVAHLIRKLARYV